MDGKFESTISLKRCDNCGWFNPSSAQRCEKCEADLSGIVPIVQNIFETTDTQSDSDFVQEAVAAPIAETDNKELPKELAGTLLIDTSTKLADTNGHALSATVLDTSVITEQINEPEYCPKCRYPLARDLEFCPNCGVTLRRAIKGNKPESFPKEMEDTDSIGELKSTVRDWSKERVSFSGNDIKKTVRDVPVRRLRETVEEPRSKTFYLIPLDISKAAPIPLTPDEVVIIGGKRYRFQK